MSLQTVTSEAPIPRGHVALLFTDVEGSTAAWERHGDRFGAALRLHDQKLGTAITHSGGYLVETAGDAFMAAFASTGDAIRCAIQMQRALAAQEQDPNWQAVGGIRIRIGIHTGEPTWRDGHYFGPPVNRAARICDAACGGMILVSGSSMHLAGNALKDDIDVIDHGLHKLKDLGQPEHLHEIVIRGLTPARSRRLRTLETRQHNLPAQVNSLVGRQRELAELHGMLGRRNHRLITLTGPGGSGKTRLAIQVAADRVQDFQDGVWLVELAATRDKDAVSAVIALALRLELAGAADPDRVVIDFLRTKQLLLVLDNFEQVVDAAPFVSQMLREAPGLVCLVTSREILRLGGEREFAIDPLSIPPAEADSGLAAYDSLQLFVERAQAAKQGFDLTDDNASAISEICRRLDGMPLAIELAAARVRGMTPAQILQRLPRMFELLSSGQRDAPERQRTLRGAIDWSYDLLSEAERDLVVELAVFSSGFFIEAAEEVCQGPDVFDLVFSLRDKSLLKSYEAQDQTRYYMLETIREYAAEKLHSTQRHATLHERHAAYFLQLAAHWSDRLANAGSDASAAMQIFATDIDNMRAGMDWCMHTSALAQTVEYGKALFPFLRRRGLYPECDTRLLLAEDAARRLGDMVVLARLLNQRGLVALDRSDFTAARGLFEASCELCKEQGDRSRLLVALMNMGNVSWATSEFAKARSEWEEALGLAAETTQERYEAVIRGNLAILECQEGRYDEASAHYTGALAMHERLGNLQGLANTLYNSSEVARLQGRFEEAMERVNKSRDIYASLGDRWGVAATTVRMGLVAWQLGDIDSARKYGDEGLGIATQTGSRHAAAYGLEVLGRVATSEGDFDRAASLLRSSFDAGLQLGDRKHQAEVLRSYARLLIGKGDPEGALRLLLIAEVELDRLRIAEVESIRAEIRALGSGMPANDVETIRADATSTVLANALECVV